LYFATFKMTDCDY